MKKSFLALVLAVALGGCNATSPASQTSSGTQINIKQINQEFEQFSSQFITEFWRENPGYAVYVGYYNYDDVLAIPNEKQQQQSLNFVNKQLAKLNTFNPDNLNANNASDYYILKNELESTLWSITEFKSGQWNPANYNVAGVFGVILNTNYKSLDERLRTIYRRMENIPAYYGAAKNNIKTATLAHTSLAISQNKGALSLFEQSMIDRLAESTLPDAEKAQFKNRVQTSVNAINDYVAWLEKLQVQLAGGSQVKDFRIGKNLYDQKFKFDIFSGFSADELYNKAVAERQRIHQEMIAITESLWPNYFTDKAMPADKLVAVKQLIDHLSVKHVKRDEFVSSIRAQIPELEAFVKKHNLLEMDEKKPLVVRETPAYQRGFAGASINAPGPYDANANTYYNVTPLDNFNDEQAESYLREYNHWILQILNIHEAVPGHYTQLVHSNKTPSMVKAIFGNGAMIEGWAVYTERMMLEQGYGDNEPELWLMFYKWHLRVITNAIIDYEIQVSGLTEEQALDQMMNLAFQQEAEARGKWRRATLSQVQLTSYFTGYAEIYALREELKQATGDKFNLTNFHNQFLSYGSAPVPIIRQLMFDDYVKKHQ